MTSTASCTTTMTVSNQSEVGRTYLPRYVLETAVRCFHLLTKGQDAAMPVSKARMCLALQSCVLSGCCLLLMALIRQLADVDRVRLSLATLSKQAEGIRAEYLCREGKAKAKAAFFSTIKGYQLLLPTIYIKFFSTIKSRVVQNRVALRMRHASGPQREAMCV